MSLCLKGCRLSWCYVFIISSIAKRHFIKYTPYIEESTWGIFYVSPSWRTRQMTDKRMGAEQDQLPSGPTETAGKRQEAETCMVRESLTCHDNLSKTTLKGTLEDGRQRKYWIVIKEWTSLPMNCSQWPPTENNRRGSLLNRSSCPRDDPIGQGTELNGTSYV